MILILQIVSSIGVLLLLVIITGFGCLFYQRYVGSQKNSTIDQAPIRKLMDRKRRSLLLSELGATGTVIQNYGELKSIISSGLEEDTLTEREIIERLGAVSRLTSARNLLERVYETYERAKFGTRGITGQEFESFADDLDGIIRILYK